MDSASTSYDGIVLGTGHNALILQAYLARCGLRVLALDSAAVPGGGLATIEHPALSGFRHNIHSFFHRAVTTMPWYRDLELERHGARYVEPELNVAMILRDGRSLQWWRDLDRTAESFAEFSRRDAAALVRWVEEFRPIVEQILIPESQSPPLPPEQRRAGLERSPLGRRLLEVARLSPLEFVQREFEHDVVRAGLLFFNGLREVDLRLAGFGHSIPALLASKHKAQMCVGGSAELAKALIADIEEHGGAVRTGVRVKSILVRSGRADGVELETGERITARCFVASGLNPQQTFLDLIDPRHAGVELRNRAARFQYNLLAPLFALNVALEEMPRYTAVERSPELEQAFMVILGLERMQQFHEIVAAHETDRVPAPVIWGACPTRFDPSQAPAGRHTAFMWEKLPYRLRGDPRNWDSAKERHADDLLAFWSEYAPNLRGAVLNRSCHSPLDTERRLPNMKDGDLLVGAFGHGQVGAHRPFRGAGHYRTPISGLYLCGGSTHPGGNITGLCGYNASAVVAADLELSLWWSPKSIS